MLVVCTSCNTLAHLATHCASVVDLELLFGGADRKAGVEIQRKESEETSILLSASVAK